MDASFAQVCLVVSATAILMGRRETLTVARYIGVGFGRFVGTLQGYRAKYETSARGSSLYEMQSSVRKELNELRGVGLDMSMVSSNRLTFNNAESMVKKAEESKYSSLQAQKPVPMPMQTSGANTASLPPLPVAAAATADMGNVTGEAGPLQQHPNIAGISPVATSLGEEENLFKLSRLILAEEQIRSTSKGVASAHDNMDSGADIISSCVTESILNRAYRVQQESSNRVDTDKFV